MTTVPQVSLAPNGPELSRIVAGTMTWGEWGADFSPARTGEMIDRARDLGVTTFDHADIYGHYSTEEAFGEGLAKHSTCDRASIQLVSKCGIKLTTARRPDHRLKSYDVTYGHIVASAERSLRNLRTDYLDLFLLHRPSPLLDPAEVARAFTHLRESGKVLHFGVSNFTPGQFALLHAAFPLVTNQVECHPLNPAVMFDGTFDQLLGHGIRPMVWSPLGGAKYFRGESTIVLRLRTTVQEIAAKYGDVGEDVVLLAWLLRHPAGCLPVVGTTKKARLSDTRLALDLPLDDQDWFAILEAARGHEVA